jgi:hypothetical protein
MTNDHSSRWERDHAARERHNAQRAHRRAERNRERAGAEQWATEDAAIEEWLRQRTNGYTDREQPEYMSEADLALSDAVFDRLAGRWRAEDEAAEAASAAAEPNEPDYGSFIIPRWIDLTEEEEELLTQAAFEYGQKREREEREARQQWAIENAVTEEMLQQRREGSEEPDLSEEEIALAETILAMSPEEFLHFQWAREDAATERYLREKAAAAHKRRTTRRR